MRLPWTKKALRFGAREPQFVDVKNLDAARAWYEEKLGLEVVHTDDDPSPTVGFSLGDGLATLILCETGDQDGTAAGSTPPVLLTRDLDLAHQTLGSRGVSVSPVETDTLGRRYFKFKDLERNVVEVLDEW